MGKQQEQQQGQQQGQQQEHDQTGAGESNRSHGSGDGASGQQGQQGSGDGASGQQGQQGSGDGASGQQGGDGDTFPRDYVERLRTESAANRTRSRDLAAELHTMRVQSLGVLADPTDLPYRDGLDSMEQVKAAAEELLTAKPHLKARRVSGNIGQHEEQGGSQSLGLLGRMRKNA